MFKSITFLLEYNFTYDIKTFFSNAIRVCSDYHLNNRKQAIIK